MDNLNTILLNTILNALENNCPEDTVFCMTKDGKRHVLCDSEDAARAVLNILETLTNYEFEIFYHDSDFTEDNRFQDTYEVYKFVDENSGHWDGVD